MPITQTQTAPSDISCADEWARVDPARLPEEWHRYRLLVCRALSAGDNCFDERDVLAMLLAERWQLIASHLDEEPVAIGVTEVIEFPRQRILLLRYAAGDKGAILAGQRYLENRARLLRCQAIETYGRKGWERLLTDWTRERVVLRKELNHA